MRMADGLAGHERLRWLAVLITVPMTWAAGCIGPWRPSSEHVVPDPKPEEVTLAPRLRANRIGRWVYEKRELPLTEDRPPTAYVRRITPRRISEGILEQGVLLPIERYLQPTGAPATRPADAARPAAPLPGGTAVFFRLAEPMEPIPLELETTGPITAVTPISYFDYRGIERATGTLKRQVQIEGVEDVDCPAGRFEGCLRVRVDLSIHFPWVAIVDLTSYLWLSPRLGEVRRVQRLSGWFLIFWFGSAHEYRLVSCEPGPDVPEPPAAPPQWACGALLLQGAFPHPRIAGMVIDFPPGPSPGP